MKRMEPEEVREPVPPRSSRRAKVRLLVRIWLIAAVIQLDLRRRPLPEVVRRLGAPGGAKPAAVSHLSRAVWRGLRIGSVRPRCLLRSLVLFRLLRAQGDPAILVIGLHAGAATSEAHAWVELHGRDVGPVPGGRGYRELARFPRPEPMALANDQSVATTRSRSSAP